MSATYWLVLLYPRSAALAGEVSPMSECVIAVGWMDQNERGLRGVIQVTKADLLPSARVRDLVSIFKAKVEAVEEKDDGFREVESVLLYGAKLHSDLLLKNVCPGPVDGCPRLVVKTVFHRKRENSIVVIVRVAENDAMVSFICKPTTRLEKIIDAMALRLGLPSSELRVLYKATGRRLSGAEALSEDGIGHGSTLYVAQEQRGGGPGITPTVFADVSDSSKLKEHKLSGAAPDWRVCGEGLNIEGECENPECGAFRETVICQKDFNAFNLMSDSDVRCPLCWCQFKPITCGFYKCAWKFEGVRSCDGYFISSPWKSTTGATYHRFDDDESNDCVDWESLLIVVKSIQASKAAKIPSATRSVVVRKDNICSVCWSYFGSTARKNICTANCGHSFHEGCVAKWSNWCSSHRALPSCPLCRKMM